MSEYITQEGAKELEKQDEKFRNAVFAHAQLLAIKEGRGVIDEVHI